MPTEKCYSNKQNQPKIYDFFISYKWGYTDHEARIIAKSLKRLGCSYFIDKENQPELESSTSLSQFILHAMKQCRHIIFFETYSKVELAKVIGGPDKVVLSKKCWQEFELEHALDKKLIVLYHNGKHLSFGKLGRLQEYRSLKEAASTIVATLAISEKKERKDREEMATPRAFVSFDFDHDKAKKDLFVGQAQKNSPTPFTVEDWSSKESLPQAEWEAVIKDKIGKCNMIIVLVGKTVASATGVGKEIAMAKDLNVPLFGVYVGDANSSSKLPQGLARGRTIPWTWAGIGKAIKQMMKEGKNK